MKVNVNSARIFSLIDLTSLNEADDAQVIQALCHKSISDLGTVAAVCIYPQFVRQAKTLLSASTVKVATVVNFPAGTDSIEKVTADIKQACQNGADEIDVVFPYLAFLQGDKTYSFDFIRQCKAVCPESVLLKVILETGALSDLALITEVSYELCHAGADFLKTSTGKIPIGATLAAAEVMLKTIRKIPRMIGFKVSGGIRTPEQAAQYIQLAEQVMGVDWVTPLHFRIGASQLLNLL